MTNPAVAILMSTYNGEKFLTEQIDSILNQSYQNIHLFIRDDGSRDNTIRVLYLYKNNPKVTIIKGNDNLGYKNSFLKLLTLVAKCQENYQYFAFADQDDVWLSEKIEKSILKLSNSNHKYCVYFGGLIFVDENLNEIKVKSYSNIITTLGAELVRHSVSGATMVFTRSLAMLVLDYEGIEKIPGGHDAFIFRLNAALDGEFISDRENYIKFRRHLNNTSNASKNLITKITKELGDSDGSEIATARYLYRKYNKKLTLDRQSDLLQIINYRKSISSKLKVILNKNFRRENKIMDLVFFYRVMFNKL
ncbi:glycosyltransferase [Leuconostoc citreum]|uniref:glycosyltransferase n=1 Tax=Leuconostoc citreum TaxID=33964 RepID=UPI0015F654D7|nr:glycosyltransferase [Leuconostoc citreum]MBA5938424.1 glycosyltransferase [Leuconostoc citreum]